MKKLVAGIFVIVMMVVSFPTFAYAGSEENKYELGEVVNTGKDNGYSGKGTINEDDPHFGWKMGRFYVSGYTRVDDENYDNPLFLKNVGDKVTLWFSLEQDINKLNGNKNLVVYNDKGTYDKYFQIEKTNFGKGALIIRHTNYQNEQGDPVIYTNYLSATAKKDVAVQVEVFEEGDYEVALNYEIQDTPFEVFGQEMFPSYKNYRIFFKFSIRNGDCMVFPMEAETGSELTNTAFTESGFSLDFAKSRYLDVDIKKEVLAEGANGLTEDIRFNRPVADGELYTEEGIYTITAKNRYTDQQTIKKIYVGTNPVLKAVVTTGMSFEEINLQIDNGATIAEDGTIVPPAELTPAPVPTITSTPTEGTPEGQTGVEEDESGDVGKWIALIVLTVVVIGAIVAVVYLRNRKKRSVVEDNEIIAVTEVVEDDSLDAIAETKAEED